MAEYRYCTKKRIIGKKCKRFKVDTYNLCDPKVWNKFKGADFILVTRSRFENQ